MLGHQLLKHFGSRHQVRVTLRQGASSYAHYHMFNTNNAYYGIDVRHTDSLRAVLNEFRPLAVINAVGIVKQRPSANESIPSIEMNALFPHRLALCCSAIGARLVHISTDCVFSGRRGNYRETDEPDANDLYGRSKVLGETHDAHCITLRTSIIGCELARKKSLLEWFLTQQRPIRGYKHTIFSGFTTIELARIIERVLVSRLQISGVYHVSSDPISKYDLLMLVKRKLRRAIEIIPDYEVRLNRSLDSSRFRTEMGYTPPSWETMVEELASAVMERNK